MWKSSYEDTRHSLLIAIALLFLKRIFFCRVALKHVLKTPVYLHSIEMERTVHRTVSHPNLMSLIDVHEDARQITLVLPYMAGGDLLDSIPADSGLESSVALSYATQLLAAIGHLHNNGFAHRYGHTHICISTMSRKIRAAPINIHFLISSVPSSQGY